MKKPFIWIVLSTGLLLLAACDKTPPAHPTPIANQPLPAESDPLAGAVANPGVPSASTIFPPASATLADPMANETDGTRKPSFAPEDVPMSKPLPGQNNDHSAPLSLAR
ncbi:hypothetical protein [Hydrogenophaga sp.]|uniref:hypothetical protein n=1 Tax=Hydrogenophaga sp. TaxID=1904254 RepID=UPI00271564B6|nr:hypothetical protein [Hydrogenophaga sp.]MDO8904085.1 hypothetical protein [Hydrogenophaga sp.]